MGGKKPWTKEEKELLFKMWAEGKTREELEKTFPSRTYRAIQLQAVRAGISRGYSSDNDFYGESYLNPHYVVGFVDGEGSFQVSINRRKNYPRILNFYFNIKLRKDDIEILHQIRNFFKCGRMYDSEYSLEKRKQHHREGSKPGVEYRVYKRGDIKDIIIPFFEEYPLQAKKKRDFQIWKEIFLLAEQLKQGNSNEHIWEQIEEKIKLLREVREYTEPSVNIKLGVGEEGRNVSK